MARYEFFVLSNPVEGQEDEYHRWYDEQHLKDVLSVDGVVSAQRFKVADLTPVAHRYVAVYGIETDDLAATLAEFGARAGTDAMPISPAYDGANATVFAYEELGPRLER